jgi:hypothetical protein
MDTILSILKEFCRYLSTELYFVTDKTKQMIDDSLSHAISVINTIHFVAMKECLVNKIPFVVKTFYICYHILLNEIPGSHGDKSEYGCLLEYCSE